MSPLLSLHSDGHRHVNVGVCWEGDVLKNYGICKRVEYNQLLGTDCLLVICVEVFTIGMGVTGSGGVGGGVVRRGHSDIAYVALVAILCLLAMLLLYFFYFFIKKVKKLSSMDIETLPTSSCRPPPAAPPAYPVQPVVREGASEMAKLCTQLPPPGKGGTVYPTSTSPAAIRTDTGEQPTEPAVPGAVAPEIPHAPRVPSAPTIPVAPTGLPEPALLKAARPVSAVEPIESVTAH